jgi:CTP-dependent riboflavin kinase
MLENKELSTEVILQGKIVTGLGEGKLFTSLPWAKEQFINKVGIDPYPGTLNLKIEKPQILDNFQKIKNHPGISIIPDNPTFCQGVCYKVIIEGNIPGAIVVPLVPEYPPDKIEIISSYNLKETLRIKDGDELSLKVIISS